MHVKADMHRKWLFSMHVVALMYKQSVFAMHMTGGGNG